MDNLIIKGPPLIASKIEKGIGEFFFEQAEIYGNKIFQIDGQNGTTESYLITKQRSTRVAVNLQKMGIKQKDVIMICCRNTLDNIIPALASFYIGARVASVDPMQTVADIKHALALVEPRAIFVEENSLPLVENSLENSDIKPEIIVIGNSSKYAKMFDMEKETDEEQSFKPLKQKGSDIVVIIFSSGTTSAPKGIYISNSYVFDGGLALIQHGNTKPGVFLHFSSLYWVSAWIVTGTTIASGSTKVIAPGITAEKFLQLIDRYKITFLFSSSTFTYQITNLPEDVIKKYDTSSLHDICIGGSTMEPKQLLKVRKLLPHTYVALGYGSSEGNCMVYHDFVNLKAYQEKISSSGTVLPETQLKIVDLDTGELLGPNREGEIHIKSPFLMSGYHKYDKPDVYDKDGFFKSGDVGYYDKDHYVYVTDRIGEMFKYRVNQISPSVIEHALLTHPAVVDAVAFGVFHPEDRNRPGACVVLKNGTNPTVQKLLEFVNSKVPDPYKLRAGLMMVDSIPKTPTEKVQRRKVRDLFIKANPTVKDE